MSNKQAFTANSGGKKQIVRRHTPLPILALKILFIILVLALLDRLLAVAVNASLLNEVAIIALAVALVLIFTVVWRRNVTNYFRTSQSTS